MSQPNRLRNAGQISQIDSTTRLAFTFDGKRFNGHVGDTLASALLANGQRLVGRSFKFHRPRGIVSAGSEEPNALVQLRTGAYQEPNTRATQAELFDGLEAVSQNYRGSLKFDLMAANDWLSPLLGAGFYYKTFMWPAKFWEKFYEPVIRASAGLGRLSGEADPSSYDKGFLHCDILIVGAGPAGLMAALTAARSGARIILCDEDFRMGGRLNAETLSIEGALATQWVAKVLNELAQTPNVRLLCRTTVFGAFDHGVYGALERVTDHMRSDSSRPRQILWRIYSKRAIISAGATERSIAFGNNDRPGIMLAGSVRAYANRWRVTPGKKVALFTNNDDGWRTATDLAANGVDVSAIIDTRADHSLSAPVGVDVYLNTRVVDTQGRRGIRSITLSNGRQIQADCLAVSGGWNPNLHLTGHQRARPIWNEKIAAFVPGKHLPVGQIVCGAANGLMTTSSALTSGLDVAQTTLSELGFALTAIELPATEDEPSSVTAFWQVKESRSRSWVDLQNDVTTKDIAQSYQEGYQSVEHMKRYTTLGMATDQGKTANVLGLAVMAECAGQSIPDTGTTIFRPPYSSVAIGAMAGRSRGKNYRPTRRTPSHDWALEQGAAFVETGLWMRAQWFPRPGETHWRESVDREVRQTRQSVGICDVTTLGKIDVQGVDAATYLDRVYANGFAKLPVGKVRYGLMLREDGLVMDDGTTARLSEHHFVTTTTTANAVGTFRHMEFCRQCLWPELDVALISVTEQYAQFAVAGPNSRELLRKVVDPAFDITNEAFPFMSCGEITICGGFPARLFRISFSGELAYELAVPTRYGDSAIRALMAAGRIFDVVPYGTEALGVMRIEKGHVAGNELNGQTTARDLGLGRMVSTSKDSIGSVLSRRPELNREDGWGLVGFIPVNQSDTLRAGAHFIPVGQTTNLDNDQGWMTSIAFSPTLDHYIGLGFIKHGANRIGEEVIAADPLRNQHTIVRVVPPCFVDAEGERLRV